MHFTKMQGLGNDYVYVNCFTEQVDEPSHLARKVSDRHFGIGADGLILMLPSDSADIRMRMFNADGSEAEMCGNGLRCIAKLAHDSGIVSAEIVRVQTLAGLKEVRLIKNDQGEVVSAVANMGVPQVQSINEQLTAANHSFDFTAVSVGNPHCVIRVDDVSSFPVQSIGPDIEKHPRFPEGANVEFCQVHSPAEISMRVWERGSGETLACGTGACASVVAGVETGYLGRKVLVHLLGGDLSITYNQDGQIIMEGPCVTVFSGEYPKED